MQAGHDPTSGCPTGAAMLTTSTRTDRNGRIRPAVPYGKWKIRTTSAMSAVANPPTYTGAWTTRLVGRA